MRTLKRSNPDGDSVKSVERAFALLRVVADERVPRSAPELAQRAGMSKPAVYRLLRAMERANVVVCDPATESLRIIRLLHGARDLRRELKAGDVR